MSTPKPKLKAKIELEKNVDQWELGMTPVDRGVNTFGEVVSVSKDDKGTYQVISGYTINGSPSVSCDCRGVDAETAMKAIIKGLVG